jgi:ElaB/YqjD/DUF883 family membrane-anchored ribosome-binding protein
MALRKTGERRGAAPADSEGGGDLHTAIPALARAAERAFHDGLERVRGRKQTREAVDAAGERLESARLYMIDRVQERPFTTTLAVLGAGFLIGLLFAGRRK